MADWTDWTESLLSTLLIIVQDNRRIQKIGLFLFLHEDAWPPTPPPTPPWQNQQNGMCAQRRQNSLVIRPVWSVFVVRMKTAWFPSYPFSAQQRPCQTGRIPRIRWAHIHFVGFVMGWLKFYCWYSGEAPQKVESTLNRRSFNVVCLPGSLIYFQLFLAYIGPHFSEHFEMK